MNYKQILFDLEGTLADPKEGITNSIRYSLAKFNICESDIDKLTQFIGPPLQKTFIEFYDFSKSDAKLAV
jgi:phosphoglycolate phosphatase